ncbi:MAG: glycoside hydrolase family 99-like domain-containing protein [Pseudomonadota bacterium]
MSEIEHREKTRVIAFYLPQFHPIPENDAWWGKGFTEWSNVARSRPLFEGHEQPRLPADLGFYDLRLSDVRAAQANMARSAGVEGFCYWHYWFGGKRLLERPFNEVLDSGEPDFPFCLGWANESWTGVWNNEPRRMLMEQTYPGEADDRAHFEYLLKAFRDRRYITVDGKPLLFIYKPLNLPDPKRRLDRWREWAHQAGLPGLHIVGNNQLDFDDAAALGLDAAVVSTLGVVNTKNALLNKTRWLLWGLSKKLDLGGPRTVRYSDAIELLIPDLSKFGFEAYPCAYPNWDHTPRSGRKGLVLTGSTPELFEQHMQLAVNAVSQRNDEHRIVFLKSWNEWAEGNYMEPDTRWGHAYLDALRRVVLRH